MEITLDFIVFIVLAIFIVVSAVLAVTTKRILRAATYLLFVLFGTAGIYFLLNYSFLGAVQLLVYAGGMTVLYVFSILLTSSEGDQAEKLKPGKMVAGLVTALAALGICLAVMLRHQFPRGAGNADNRPRADVDGQGWLCPSFRGDKHSAARLHRGRSYDSEETIVKKELI